MTTSQREYGAIFSSKWRKILLPNACSCIWKTLPRVHRPSAQRIYSASVNTAKYSGGTTNTMNTEPRLLSRDAFREAVFQRTSHRCTVGICSATAQDAHHIIERRLFPDGGYYLDNGAALCARHHILAEQTLLTCDELREALGIRSVILPPHLYPDERYDKWGNVILPNGRRLMGELFDDESVRKILEPVLHLFDHRVKYPRTWHLPWSPSVSPDDRVLDADTVDGWRNTEVVITEKMDGECTTLYHDYLHARSVDYSSHVTRNWMRNYHAQFAHDIPVGMRICGENLSFRHSIHYTDLPMKFMVFSVWDGTRCLSWRDTLEWCTLLGLTPVPIVWCGLFDGDVRQLRRTAAGVEETDGREGYVIRPSRAFSLRDFSTVVGKYVRKNHVRTHGHWMRSHFVPNEVAK
jgi:hypothetical protein